MPAEEAPRYSELVRAIDGGDVETLNRALAGQRDVLLEVLRDSLRPSTDFVPPAGSILKRGGTDANFRLAKQFLEQRSTDALRLFDQLRLSHPDSPVAAEWSVYCSLTLDPPSAESRDRLTSDMQRLETAYAFTPWTLFWNWHLALAELGDSAGSQEKLRAAVECIPHGTPVAESSLRAAFGASERLPQELSRSYSCVGVLAAASIEGAPRTPAGLAGLRKICRLAELNGSAVFPAPQPKDDLNERFSTFYMLGLYRPGAEWFIQALAMPSNLSESLSKWKNAACLLAAAGDIAAVERLLKRAGVHSNLVALRGEVLGWMATNLGRELPPLAATEDVFASARRLEPPISRSAGMPEFGAQPVLPSRQESSSNAGIVARSLDVANFLPAEQRDADEDKESLVRLLDLPRLFKDVDLETLRNLRPAAEELLTLSSSMRTAVDPVAVAAVVRLRQALEFLWRDTRYESDADEVRQLYPALNVDLLPAELHYLAGACLHQLRVMSHQYRFARPAGLTGPESLGASIALPQDGEGYSSNLAIRVTNPNSWDMEDAEITLQFATHGIGPTEELTRLKTVPAEGKLFVSIPIRVDGEFVGDAVPYVLEIGPPIRSAWPRSSVEGRIPVEDLTSSIPELGLFHTSLPITRERADLFHGRGSELRTWRRAIAGGQPVESPLFTGIRRVGKTSFLLWLGAEKLGDQTRTVFVDLDTCSDGVTDNFDANVVGNALVELSADKYRLSPIPFVEAITRCAAQYTPGPRPWYDLAEILTAAMRESGADRLVVCFDEVQAYVGRFSVRGRGDPGFLSWWKSWLGRSDSLFVVGASSAMKRTLASLMPHDVWARLLERRISFVDKMSMQLIATSPLKPFGVVYRAESIEALWDLTEGHPWLTQVVAHQLAPRLNAERRRLVVPNDIEVASFDAAMGGEVGRLWWNESEGSVTAVHRETALILLAHLRGDVRLVEEAELLVAMRAAGIAGGPAILEEMEALQLFAKDDIDGRSAWRFRARFLQRHVEAIAGRASAYGNAPAAERQAAPQELQEVLAFLENIDAKVDKLPDEITARISRLSELDDQWRGLEEQIKNLPETIVDGCRNLAISWVGRPCWDSLSTDSRSDLLGIATMLQNNENDAPPLALTGLFILVERELRLAANRAGVTVERGATLDPLVESLMAELPVHDPLWKAARDIKMANLVAARNRGIHGGAIAERDRDRLVRQLFKNESDDGLVARLTAASRSG